MPQALTPLTQLDDLEARLADSSEKPLILFKHSRLCEVSAYAYEELLAHARGRADSDVSYGLVTVQTSRPLSNEIAARLNITHHTPQVILVYRGQAVWSASHFRISGEAIDEAIRSLRSAA